MSEPRSLSRRSALAGLGAGSIAAFVGAHAAAHTPLENRDIGADSGGPSGLTTANHRLTGHWLSMIGLPSNPDVTVAVPTFFSPDGTAVLVFPGTEAAARGIHIAGAAVGVWEIVDEQSGHFTAIQVLSNLNGEYVGTVEIDAFASLDEVEDKYACDSSRHSFVVRDHLNAVVSRHSASVTNPMRGQRMRAGFAGFPASEPAENYEERRTPD